MQLPSVDQSVAICSEHAPFWVPHCPSLQLSPTRRVHAGFASLPTDIQTKILRLHLASERVRRTRQHGEPVASHGGVRAVCKAWEAQSFVERHARRDLSIEGFDPRSAALLPYLTGLQELLCSPSSRGLCAILSSLLFPMPHLRALSLTDLPLCDRAALVGILAAHTQLTRLHLVGFPTSEPLTLPYLRHLELSAPFHLGDAPDDRPGLLVGLERLSEMTRLTALD